MRELAGRTEFATGGTSRIGPGMAKAFARAGINVAAVEARSSIRREAP